MTTLQTQDLFLTQLKVKGSSSRSSKATKIEFTGGGGVNGSVEYYFFHPHMFHFLISKNSAQPQQLAKTYKVTCYASWKCFCLNQSGIHILLIRNFSMTLTRVTFFQGTWAELPRNGYCLIIEFKVLNLSHSVGFSMLSFIQTRSEDLSAFLTCDSRNELVISHHLHYSVDCFPVEKGKTKTTVMWPLGHERNKSPWELHQSYTTGHSWSVGLFTVVLGVFSGFLLSFWCCW